MILNKQRLAAVDELEQLKKDKEELLERINQLEAESQIVIKKGLIFLNSLYSF
jgi:cell division protein FtsB